MPTKETKLSVVYPDNFSEHYTVSTMDLTRILNEAMDEGRLYFRIGEKKFNKTDVAVLATSDQTIEFL